MVAVKTLNTVAQHIDMKKDELINEGVIALLIDKKSALLSERLEVLRKYNVPSVDALRKKIKQGQVKEHPAWEDLIETRNIDAEIKVINNDIRALRRTV